MCVCMCVCVCVCVYVCVYVYVYVYVYIHCITYVNIYISIYLGKRDLQSDMLHVCMCVHMYVYAHVDTYVYIWHTVRMSICMMYTAVYIQCAHVSVPTVCTQLAHVHCLYTVCTLYVHGMYTVCTRYVHDCTLHVHSWHGSTLCACTSIGRQAVCKPMYVSIFTWVSICMCIHMYTQVHILFFYIHTCAYCIFIN
jgi:hypothetical protein